MQPQFNFSCKTVDDTKHLARAIGQAVRGGEVLELGSDLGGGKTTFVKGLAEGMLVKNVVQSPTFTISQIHKAGKGLELHHFDFYRLQDAGVMSAELAESLAQSNAIVAVEWGDIVHDVLPVERMSIQLAVQDDDETRIVRIAVPKAYDHIREALTRYQQEHKIA